MTLDKIFSKARLTLNFACDFLNTTLPRLRDLGLRIEPEKVAISQEQNGKIWCNMNVYDGEFLEIAVSFLTPEIMANLVKLLERKTFERQLPDLAPRILAVNWQPDDEYVPRHAAPETHSAKHFAMEEAKARAGIADDESAVNTVSFRTGSGEVLTFPVSYTGMLELRDALHQAEAIRDLAPYWPYFEQVDWLVTLTDHQTIAHYNGSDHIYNFRPEEIRDLISDLRKAWDEKHAVPIPFSGEMVYVEPSANALPTDNII